MVRCILCNAADYKDNIDANRYIITILKLVLPFELDPDGLGTKDPQQCHSYEPCLTVNAIKSAVLQNFTVPPSTSIHKDANKARIVATVHLSKNTDLLHVSTANCILDTQYSAMGPSHREYNDSIFGR